jgi:nucleotide-binding universal stress UspA family protein
VVNEIVVGAADSEAGRRALEWAARRAVAHRQPVVLIGVIGGATGAVGESAIIGAAIEATTAYLDEMAAPLRERGLQVEVRARAGNPVSVLIDASKDAALLVIGSDYRGPGHGPARGSHGVRIAAAAHCPVIVVPEVDAEARAGVVVGIDGSEVSEGATRFAAQEADRLGEPLIAVTVWTPVPLPRHVGAYPTEYMESMESMAAETLGVALAGLRQDYPDLQIEERVEHGYPSEIINDIAATARMIVVGSHGRGAVARFLLGSISHEVLARLAKVTAVVR